jgi:P-type conjugative transfer protein TrbG
MKYFGLVLSLVLVANAAAQSPRPTETQPQPAAVNVKRVPPGQQPVANSTADTLRKQVNEDLKALQQPVQRVAGPNPQPNDSKLTNVALTPKADMPLTATAQAAVLLSEKWLTETTSPAPGADGRVVYTYGSGLPTVVCAPLRICMVELQSGERLIGEPHIGDSVRWSISPGLFGKGEGSTTVIVLKPLDTGLDTNLLLTTDRRAYYMRLVSKPEDYIARVAFAYPADDIADQRWKEHLARQEQEQIEATRIAELSPTAIESMNFNYSIKGGNDSIRPMQVFDDGKKTYIRMNPDTQHREAPVLVVIGADGKGEMLNYRVKGDMYIADRLFEKAQLVLGSDKKAKKVEITRGKSKES